ncbi:HEXXH motif domain-containing protein [Streptomyces sp. NPDC005402]|uniref:HEXXH motif domain-containing protein n=1 Tax=Streptomyces sp. NPDC005402 TaxID=3155338 RepID=UPI0033A3F2C0
MLGRHRTPTSDLDDLAVGRVRPGTARRLWAVERSRRMLMLRAVVESARQPLAGTPLPPEAALEMLLRVEEARPDVVADLLEHPGTGIWAVRMLKRLRSGEHPQGATPLWAEAGYLHCLAAAGALRAGVEGTIRLPVRGALVALPTLGRVRLPAIAADDPGARSPDVVTLIAPPPGEGPAWLLVGGRRMSLPADLREPSGTWEPSHRIAWSPRPQDPPLVLEDGDPYRDFRGDRAQAPAAGLAGAETGPWRRMLGEAGEVLHGRHPRAASLLTESLRVVVPLPTGSRFRTASASYNEAVGSALVSLPPDATELAVTLVHEARHSVLNALLHQLPLCEDDGPLHYAPWRGDPRPLSGLLHGTYAFAGVADFWRVERGALSGPPAELAHFEFVVWRDAVAGALDTLLESSGLTDAGRLFVTRMAEETADWHAEPAPGRPLALARSETADLRAVWRARHLRLPPDQVAVVADAWRCGAEPETAPVVRASLRPDPRSGTPDLRSRLRRVLLADSGALERTAVLGSAEDGRPETLAAADVHLLRGSADQAVRGYRDVLAKHPGSASAWAGLGLALAETGQPSAAHALLAHPELVRAVYEQTTAAHRATPDPVSVADWIGRTPAVRDGG